MTRRRVTVVLDDVVVRKLHHIRSKMIKKEKSTYSFSRVINEELRKALK